MKYLNFRKFFFDNIAKKFNKDYKININSWFPNPYIKLKYKYICEAASIFFYIFLKTNITPNFITIANILFAILASLIFMFNVGELKFLGLFIFFSKTILDIVDGFIAREKKLTSKIGTKLDPICGHIYYYSIFLSLIFHNYYSSYNNKIILLIGFLVILLDVTNLSFSKETKKAGKINKNYFFRKIYIFLKIINFDGRTSKTDLILFIILIETINNFYIFSQFLIYLFLAPKILRNSYHLYKWIK